VGAGVVMDKDNPEMPRDARELRPSSPCIPAIQAGHAFWSNCLGEVSDPDPKTTHFCMCMHVSDYGSHLKTVKTQGKLLVESFAP
jgi:hypothetical protein